uniref:Uncharacterized protein n=1 Tax=virus sp. cti5L29 TaxID=2826813 RepID=A0A8S5R930_9VIRU|nr:MAG TPA: hypothetical protein [virus sp. cti5L29]
MNNNPMEMIMQMLSGGGDPRNMLQGMMSQNPQFNAIMNQAKQSGMSMEQFTRQYAKQNNIDIQPLINMINKNGRRF